MEITNFETMAILNKLDNLEEKIRLADEINKQYDDLKKQIKEKMLEIGKENNLEQLKWTTPNGTQITCSVGHKAEWEDQEIEEFDLEVLKKDYSEIYEKCVVKKNKKVCIKNASNDTLRITLPKNDKGE